ncbi:MAG: methionyl-tRNA formyltransferase, partial [Bacteroidetes bacterium]|nr:methionyl-tRNA formyltransferase [Bacteroidota bacterium]
MIKKPLNIVYMGTPEFAVAPLDTLLNNGYKISAVITSPDKPAGRGLKINESSVKKYAVEHGLKVLQPTNLKSPEFIDELKSINPDLQIVVAFRMLPEILWKLPVIGTFNLHASLLPQYRGAAPINWAIINGESKTGVTTFFINENIDTGNIIMAQEEKILPDDTAGELHDRLMKTGAGLVLKTVRSVEINNYNATPQNSMFSEFSDLKIAPKIFKNTCK